VEKLLVCVSICVTIILLSIISGFTFYKINDRRLMSGNIDNAISKGIDPISVRCSFAESDDSICVAMAASQQYNRVVVSAATGAVVAPKK
jgi:uncharacterized membrane protein